MKKARERNPTLAVINCRLQAEVNGCWRSTATRLVVVTDVRDNGDNAEWRCV